MKPPRGTDKDCYAQGPSASSAFPANGTDEGGTARLILVTLSENGFHMGRSQALYDLQGHSWYKLPLRQHHEAGTWGALRCYGWRKPPGSFASKETEGLDRAESLAVFGQHGLA